MADTLRLYEPSDSGKIPDGPLTVGQVVQLYLDNGIKSANPDALKERERILNLFCEAVGHQLVSETKPHALLWWINSRTGLKSDWSIRRWIITVKTPFTWAVRLGLIDKNPFLAISHEPGPSGRSMKPEEFQAMLRQSTPVFRRILIFLRFSGCRPKEASSLEWSHWDEARGCFILGIHKTFKKTRKPRVIVMPETLLKLLAWIRRNSPPDSRYVLVNSFGRPWNRNSLCKRVDRLKKKLGLAKDTKLYGTRHAMASAAILNGVDIKTVSTLLGHANTRITESTYVHIEGEIDHLRAAVERAGKRKGPAGN